MEASDGIIYLVLYLEHMVSIAATIVYEIIHLENWQWPCTAIWNAGIVIVISLLPLVNIYNCS